MDDGDAAAAEGGRHVGIREHGPEDRLGVRHDLSALPDVGDHARYELLSPGVLTVSPAPVRPSARPPTAGERPRGGSAPIRRRCRGGWSSNLRRT